MLRALLASIHHISTASPFVFFEEGVRKITGMDARDSCTCCTGVAPGELLPPLFGYFYSLFLQTQTNLAPVLLQVAMAISEVLHGPAAICSSPVQEDPTGSQRSELASGLTPNQIRTAASRIHHI